MSAPTSPSVKRIKLTLPEHPPASPISHGYQSRFYPADGTMLNAPMHYSPQSKYLPIYYSGQMQGYPVYDSLGQQYVNPFLSPLSCNQATGITQQIPSPALFQFKTVTSQITTPVTPAKSLDQAPVSVTERKARNAIQEALKPNSVLTQSWAVHSIVGWGGNGVILTASRRSLGSRLDNNVVDNPAVGVVVAIKIVYKTTRAGKRCFPITSEFSQLPSELRVLASIKAFDGLLKYHEWFEDDLFYFVVTEWVPVMEKLSKRIRINSDEEQTGVYLPIYTKSSDLYTYLEKSSVTVAFTRKMFGILAKTVLYLHENDISHGDIKRIFLFVRTDGPSFVTLDTHTLPSACTVSFSPSPLIQALYGTTDMTAPELLKNTKLPKESQTKSLGFPLDVWAFGLTMFGSLGGKSPVNGIVDWTSLKRLPKGCMALLKGMLNNDPRKRYSMHQVANHPFLSS